MSFSAAFSSSVELSKSCWPKSPSSTLLSLLFELKLSARRRPPLLSRRTSPFCYEYFFNEDFDNRGSSRDYYFHFYFSYFYFFPYIVLMTVSAVLQPPSSLASTCPHFEHQQELVPQQQPLNGFRFRPL